MCGIFGGVSPVTDQWIADDVVQKALDSMRHRGPDEQGIERFKSLHCSGIFGHVRLSIIDLSGGRQPMKSDDEHVLLSYNGEIYNYIELKQTLSEMGHEFSDHSDTEVLLHAYQQWGESCVEQLRGMFAFAIWDNTSERLFIARDHYGKKPLFYLQKGKTLYFASEIKALLQIPDVSLSFNQSQLRNYCVYRYVPSPETWFEQIRKLPAGHSMTWEKGDISFSRYFSPAKFPSIPKPLSSHDAVTRFWALLDEAVRLRMAADVPFGAFLSGGIDSSAIVALMSGHSEQPVKTFSIGFNESEYSELAYAATIARQFNTEHHELTVSQDDLMALLPEVIRYRDAPVCEPSDIPVFLLAKQARRSVKMVLTGEGSDEILGGYPKHAFERFVPIYHLVPGLVRHRVLESLINFLPYRFRRAKTAISNMNTENFDERMPGWFGGLSLKDANALVAQPGQSDLPALEVCRRDGQLDNILMFDQLSWLPDNLLERGDRMTMAASLEARMPFMDVRLAEFVASLPRNYLVRGRTSKWILRAAMKKILPAEILERPKVGFRVPVNVWFRTTMKDYIRDHLCSGASVTRQFYHTGFLDEIITQHISGKQNHEKVLWMLLNLEIWFRQNSGRFDIRS